MSNTFFSYTHSCELKHSIFCLSNCTQYFVFVHKHEQDTESPSEHTNSNTCIFDMLFYFCWSYERILISCHFLHITFLCFFSIYGGQSVQVSKDLCHVVDWQWMIDSLQSMCQLAMSAHSLLLKYARV